MGKIWGNQKSGKLSKIWVFPDNMDTLASLVWVDISDKCPEICLVGSGTGPDFTRIRVKNAKSGIRLPKFYN
jgi:hypothetical protein